MQRATLAWLLAAALVASALGAGLADPLDAGAAREPIGLDEPPAQAARSALATAATGDYTVRIAVGEADGTAHSRSVVRVENSERQVVARTAGDRPAYLLFANAHAGWRGPPGALERGAGDWAQHNTPFGHLDALTGAPVTRTDANGTARLRVDADDVAKRLVGYGEGIRGNATLTVAVDSAAGTLLTVTFERAWTEADGEQAYRGTVWRFSEWGTTEVQRPASAGYSLVEFLLDATE